MASFHLASRQQHSTVVWPERTSQKCMGLDQKELGFSTNQIHIIQYFIEREQVIKTTEKQQLLQIMSSFD